MFYLSLLMSKPTKWHVRPAETQVSLGIRPAWSESLLSAWRNLGPLATHWAHSEDSDQTGRMPRLIWVFAGRTVILFVLSWGGSFTLYWQVYRREMACHTTTWQQHLNPCTTLYPIMHERIMRVHYGTCIRTNRYNNPLRSPWFPYIGHFG